MSFGSGQWHRLAKAFHPAPFVNGKALSEHFPEEAFLGTIEQLNSVRWALSPLKLIYTKSPLPQQFMYVLEHVQPPIIFFSCLVEMVFVMNKVQAYTTLGWLHNLIQQRKGAVSQMFLLLCSSYKVHWPFDTLQEWVPWNLNCLKIWGQTTGNCIIVPSKNYLFHNLFNKEATLSIFTKIMFINCIEEN